MQRTPDRPRDIGYLEGPISVVPAAVDRLSFGPLHIEQYDADVEVPNPNNLSIPLDGIIGIRNFARSEWWFDADGTPGK